ncbi:D-cysteine desulfhydrase family protein [Streptomyces sp. NBC_00198]|uniref:D-cysteine desulfhydrase family protein n=1 Tax=Streptomyces sp. NBC_00198 TaxID=2975677 RepID=UPI00225647E7|nr:D-cysteine desulfhydrase family protein [Streptomyces sp. NBC_00198]MCX5280178.1 D-cysteine desulfhydrase family protein [Streptomyces sp. NBC_00198]
MTSTLSEGDTPPRARLGSWPTPLEPAPRLAAALGLRPDDLWVKRDDLTGLGGGGNKIRKLEWTCGAALADGATVLVTTGAAQSNHARLTAAAGARLGLRVVLVLAGPPPESGPSGAPANTASGNLALDGLLGARVVWEGDRTRLAARAEQVAEELRAAGEVPALIPFGGSSPLGARGYAECANEIMDQAPDVASVVVALGSGGTMAGLVAGLGDERVLGVHVGAVDEPARTVADLVSLLCGRPCDPRALRVRHDQVGAGYATLTEPVMNALTLAAHTEGIVLDPIYTGRALAGLAAAVTDGDITPGQRTVFLHTGGLPGFFGHPTAVTRAEAGLRGLPDDPTAPWPSP